VDFVVFIEKGKTSHGAFVPDLPGCVAVGESRRKALKLIRESIQIRPMREAGEPVPTPTSKSEIVKTRAALSKEFLKPMGISQYRLAKEIDVPAQRIGDIVMGKRAITADTEVAERQLGSRLGNIRPWTLAIREPTRKSRVRARK
jgi:addiction module HigA family antidote